MIEFSETLLGSLTMNEKNDNNFQAVNDSVWPEAESSPVHTVYEKPKKLSMFDRINEAVQLTKATFEVVADHKNTKAAIEWSKQSALLRGAGHSLWIGSYFGLIKQLPKPPSVIVDLDHGALQYASRCWPKIPSTQADIRHLPFRQCFDRILVPGCVSAYLLDECSVIQTVKSLFGALKHQFGSSLYVDAYDIESILDTAYFNGEQILTIKGLNWQRRAWTEQISNYPFVFDVKLLFICLDDREVEPIFLHFRQRAFEKHRLREVFEDQGICCSSEVQDVKLGRFYQIFTI